LQNRVVSRSPWLWLNLVCLDAPLVAICWQWIFAHSVHLSVPIRHQAALFLTAWVIYLADRLGDSVSLVRGQPKSVRQQFCLRHKSLWLVSIIGVAALDMIVVLRAVDYETAVPGAILGAFTIAYLAINHAHSEIWEAIPLKEFTIGSLFAAGTLLGVSPHIFVEGSTTIFAAILFASLCSLNCVSIAIWERDLDRIQGRHSIATRWAHANFLPRLLLLVLLAGSVLLGLFDPGAWPVALCLGASGLLLGRCVLSRCREMNARPLPISFFSCHSPCSLRRNSCELRSCCAALSLARSNRLRQRIATGPDLLDQHARTAKTHSNPG
jgi:hypothetical protein